MYIYIIYIYTHTYINTLCKSNKYSLKIAQHNSVINLFFNKKLERARYKGHNLLNKRSEIISKCHHRSKFALASYDIKE